MHTYGTVADFKALLGPPDPGNDSDAELLDVLEDASRAVEDFCERSRHGSGFGPRIGTNHYTGEGNRSLWLDDDLLSVSSLTVLYSVSGSPTSFTENTDYYALPFDGTPKRRLDAIPNATVGLVFTTVQRGIAVTGTFGYSDDRVTMAETTAEALDASETGVDVSSGTAFSPGMTILVDSEQMYVTAVSTNTLTVDRGANGTTAATHLTGAAIQRYRYPRRVRLATLLLAQRTWRQKDAGSDGGFGGGDIPVTSFRETDRSLLRSKLYRLRCVTTAEGHLAESGATAA